MSIYIYNSLTRKKEPFEPLSPQEIKMYVCGPTVYDQPHIGHARSAYIFDVIRRYLSRSYKVRFVRNVTDVDDKIIDKAKKEFPNIDVIDAAKRVSVKYLDAYHEDMSILGIKAPDYEPKATEYIDANNPQMQKFITHLIRRGTAYVSGGDVYFDIKKAKDYGKLSHQSIDKMETGIRAKSGENKKDPLDFALWKAVKEGEPSWDSPWGKGRPGWHIECSVMSRALLGDEFDIHGGGLDLIFPHHENEIAQSEGAGYKFAKTWIHHGLLTINGQKMSKSLGNFVTLKNFIKEHKDSNILKMFFLSTHYAHPINYTEEKIEEAKKALGRILILRDKIGSKGTSAPVHQCTSELKKEVERIKNKFITSMDDDFNTPQGLAAIFELVNFLNKNIDDLGIIAEGGNVLFELLGIFGLDLANIETHAYSITSDTTIVSVDELINKRNRAKMVKDFIEADGIRKELEKQGIILEDAKDGKTTWRRKL